MSNFYFVYDDLEGAFYADGKKVFIEKLEYIDDVGGLLQYLRKHYPQNNQFVEVHNATKEIYLCDLDMDDVEDYGFPDFFNDDWLCEGCNV